MTETYEPGSLAKISPSYRPGPVCTRRTCSGRADPSGPTTLALTFMKFRNDASLFSASTTILALLPSTVIDASRSLLIGGRETPRTTCAQKRSYISLCTHDAPHLVVASLVYA